MKNIKVSAIVIGLFLGFIFPLVLFFSLGPLAAVLSDKEQVVFGLWGLLFWLFLNIAGPVSAGYITAKLARQQPLLHACIVGILGIIALAVLIEPISAALAECFFVIPGAIFGGWLWRKHSRKDSLD